MAKGYWIAHVTVHDMDRYKEYVRLNAAPFAEYGAKFLVRGGAFESRAGLHPEGQRHVVLEFESYAVAKACYDSPAYQAAAKVRDEAATVDLVIVEGYDG